MNLKTNPVTHSVDTCQPSWTACCRDSTVMSGQKTRTKIEIFLIPSWRQNKITQGCLLMWDTSLEGQMSHWVPLVPAETNTASLEGICSSTLWVYYHGFGFFARVFHPQENSSKIFESFLKNSTSIVLSLITSSAATCTNVCKACLHNS